MFGKISPMPSKPKKSPCSFSCFPAGQKHKSPLLFLIPLCLVGFSIGLTGCGNSAPLGIGGFNFGNFGVRASQISDIQQNANVVATVYLEGQVINRAPLIGFGAYHLKDETGTIWVLTNQVLPNLGDQVLIKGQTQFHSIPVAGQELGEVYIQEQQQLKRNPGKLPQAVPSPEAL